MVDLQNVGDVKGAVLGAAGLVHDLSVHVASWGHNHDDVFTFLVEQESGVSDLWAWQKEVVHGAQGVHR